MVDEERGSKLGALARFETVGLNLILISIYNSSQTSKVIAKC